MGIFLAVCIAPASSALAVAAGSIGVRLLDTPADAVADPRARDYIVDHMAPGAVIERRIEVSNTTAETAQVVLYPSAATIQDGSFLGADGHTANDLSTWTLVTPETVAIPAGEKSIAKVTIKVPNDAAPGERYGVVWAEVRSTPESGGVIQVNRVGVRLYVSIGPGGPPAADFTVDSMTAQRSDDGRPVVQAGVRNTGGRALDLNGELRLTGGPGGLSAGPFPASLGKTLAIGDTGEVTVELDKQVPAGPWDAELTMRSGLEGRTAKAVITFPATGSSPVVATTGDPNLLPWIVGGLIVVLVVAVAIALRRRKGSLT